MSQDLDINALMDALKNENNENIMDNNHDTIRDMKIKMLNKLNIPIDKLNALMKTLEHYKYIDELPELNFGAYIRWIPLKNPSEIKLTNGGFVCDVKIEDGINVVCRNKMNRFFQLKMGDCLIFQKLSDQERVLLSAMDFLKS